MVQSKSKAIGQLVSESKIFSSPLAMAPGELIEW